MILFSSLLFYFVKFSLYLSLALSLSLTYLSVALYFFLSLTLSLPLLISLWPRLSLSLSVGSEGCARFGCMRARVCVYVCVCLYVRVAANKKECVSCCF